MDYYTFLNSAINNGIAAATEDYTKISEKNKLEGSIAGFEACRNKTPEELKEVWKEGQEYAQRYFGDYDNVDTYWWYRCYVLEVEWICNMVSCILINEGQPPVFSWLPTCNAMMATSKIVGVKSGNDLDTFI